MHHSYEPFSTLSAGASGKDPIPAARLLTLNAHSQLAFHVEPSAYTSRFHIGTVAFNSSIAKWHASIKEGGGEGDDQPTSRQERNKGKGESESTHPKPRAYSLVS